MRVWDQQRQTTIYRMDKQQVLLYSTGNYTQYPLINCGNEYEKEYIHICITESFCCTEKKKLKKNKTTKQKGRNKKNKSRNSMKIKPATPKLFL